MKVWSRHMFFALIAVSIGVWMAASPAEAWQPAKARKVHSIVPRTPVPVTPRATQSAATATATLSLGTGYPQACPGLEDKGVPQSHIAAALEDPSRVAHWNEPADANKPVSPYNPRRRRLAVQTDSKPYHSLFNGLVFKTGCP